MKLFKWTFPRCFAVSWQWRFLWQSLVWGWDQQPTPTPRDVDEETTISEIFQIQFGQRYPAGESALWMN